MKGLQMKDCFRSRFQVSFLAILVLLAGCATSTDQTTAGIASVSSPDKKLAPTKSGADQQAKRDCESSQTDMDVRRKSCLQYFLSSGSGRKLSVSVLPTFQMFCNFDGVSCSKNGAKFGKGQINEFLPRHQLKGNSFRIAHKKSSDHYEYMAVK